jgi:hypothetical protein
VALRGSTRTGRGSDDRGQITAGRAAGQSGRRRFPAQRGRSCGAIVDGDGGGRLDRRGTARAVWRSHDLPHRLSRPGPGDTAGQPATAPSEAAAGRLLSAFPGGSQDLKEGAGCRDPGSLAWWRLDPACRRPGAGHGAGGHQQEHGEQAVQGSRRARRRFSGSPPGGGVALSGWMRPISSRAQAGASSR